MESDSKKIEATKSSNRWNSKYRKLKQAFSSKCSVHCTKSVQIRSFFWSVFSRIWTECGEFWSKPPHSVQMRGNAARKKLRIWSLSKSWWRITMKLPRGNAESYLQWIKSSISPLDKDISLYYSCSLQMQVVRSPCNNMNNIHLLIFFLSFRTLTF